MESTIKVSVLCAAYNHERYIRKCLDGFVMQKTNFKYEVLINDDASTDNTAQIIREYEEKYPDIIKPIYQTENQYSKGVRITTEILGPKAKGKYIAFCEGDDFWTDENKLQAQVEALEAHPECKMCVHKVKGFYDNQEKDEYYPPSSLKETQRTGIINSYDFIRITMEYVFQTSSYFFDGDAFKTYIKENPLFKQISPVGDVCFLLYFGDKAPVYYIEACMSCYRRNSIGSWSQKIRSNNGKEFRHNYSDKMIKAYIEYNNYTNDKYKKLIDERIFGELWAMGNFKEMFSKQYTANRKKLSIKVKLYIWLKAYFPCIMKALKK